MKLCRSVYDTFIMATIYRTPEVLETAEVWPAYMTVIATVEILCTGCEAELVSDSEVGATVTVEHIY